MKKSLSGKTALVTGAGSGIGRALALELAAQGANLALTDINQERLSRVREEIEAKGLSARGYRVDHARLDETEQFKEAYAADWGPPDVLCLNAGVALTAEIPEMTIEKWERIIQINLMGTIYMVQLFVPEMIERRAGRILITASLAALVGFPGAAAYSASKFAVRGLGESLRAELRQHGISVSTLCPGIVRTRLISDGEVSFKSKGLGQDSIDRFWQRIGEEPATVARRAIAGLLAGQGLIGSSPLYVGLPWAAKRLVGDALGNGVGALWANQDKIKQALGRLRRQG